MAISPISASMPISYTSPNFKGAPRLNAATITRVASEAAETAQKSEGLFKRMKTAWNKGYDNFVEKAIVNPFLKPLMNSDLMGNLAEKTKNTKNMAAHMSTAGSFVTTGTYMYTSLKTLNKDEEQKKRAKTLALNQLMVTGLSTVLGYAINDKLGNFSKQLGYKFREANQGNPHLDKRMTGFNTAKSLLIFAVMYRYVAPVVVTPLASKLGNYFNSRSDKKAAQAANPAPANNNIATAKK